MAKTRTLLLALFAALQLSPAHAEPSDLANAIRHTLMVGCLPSLIAPDKISFAPDQHKAWDTFLETPREIPDQVTKPGRIFMQEVKYVVANKKYPESIYLLSSPDTLECGVMLVGKWDETVMPMIEEEFGARPWQPYKLDDEEWRQQLKDWQFFKAYKWERPDHAISVAAQRHSLAAEHPEGMQLFVKLGITALEDKK